MIACQTKLVAFILKVMVQMMSICLNFNKFKIIKTDTKKRLNYS